MKIFLDANILVSVLNKEYPLFTYTARILSLSESREYTIITSPVCLAIAFYFAEKKYKAITAKEKIKILASHIEIAAINAACIDKALQNRRITDFEDGMEYYAAVENKCHCIVTEDRNDFFFSDIEVLSSEDFFKKYMKSK